MKRFGTVYGGFHYPNDLDGLNIDSIISNHAMEHVPLPLK